MGYNLYITRADFWPVNQDSMITAAEWNALVTKDPELNPDKRNGEYFTQWAATSGFNTAWFDWHGGNIFTKNPDQATFQKMLEIANRLDAVVQGDDGESYESVGDYLRETEAARTIDPGQTRRVLSFRLRETIWNIMIFGLIIVTILAINLLNLW